MKIHKNCKCKMCLRLGSCEAHDKAEIKLMEAIFRWEKSGTLRNWLLIEKAACNYAPAKRSK